MAHFSPRLTPWAVLFRHSVAPWLMSYAPGIRPALPVVSLSLVAAVLRRRRAPRQRRTPEAN